MCSVEWKKVKQSILIFYKDIATKKQYKHPLVFFAALAYGFSLFNRTVSIDDLSRDYYNGSGNAMLSATRWGMNLWIKLFSTSKAYTPFVDKLFAVLFLLLSAVLFSSILYSINRNKNVWQYTVFSSLFVTYPLINEIWEFSGASLIVCGNFVLIAIAVLYQLYADEINLKRIIVAGVILSPIMAGYESGIFAYITLVLIILYLKYGYLDSKAKIKQWISEGVGYALPLVISLLIRILVGFALLKLYGLEYSGNGETQISWDNGIIATVVNILYKNAVMYGLYGLAYFPVTVFICAAVFFAVLIVIYSIKRKTILPFLTGLSVLVSLFLVGIIQGKEMPYRIAQTIHIFVAFAGYLLIQLCGSAGKRRSSVKATSIMTALLLFLSMRQAIYLHTVLALNNQRSDNEAAIIQNLGQRLYSEVDRSKPVVFAGEVDLGDDIMNQVSVGENSLYSKAVDKLVSITGKTENKHERLKYVRTNVNSVINWANVASDSHESLKAYLSYYGYDINIMEAYGGHSPSYYYQIAVENDMNPLEIREMDEFVLVFLGEKAA